MTEARQTSSWGSKSRFWHSNPHGVKLPAHKYSALQRDLFSWLHKSLPNVAEELTWPRAWADYILGPLTSKLIERMETAASGLPGFIPLKLNLYLDSFCNWQLISYQFSRVSYTKNVTLWGRQEKTQHVNIWTRVCRKNNTLFGLFTASNSSIYSGVQWLILPQNK